MDIRRVTVHEDTVHAEGAFVAAAPVTRVAACAVIANPFAEIAKDDLQELVLIGAELGALLVKEAAARHGGPAVSYGKAASAGTAGDIERAAAILHPRMGKPMREAIGGGQAIIPPAAKIGAVNESIGVPFGHKDDIWSFGRIDTLTVTVPNAPRPDEIAIMVALADGGRPRPRVSKG